MSCSGVIQRVLMAYTTKTGRAFKNKPPGRSNTFTAEKMQDLLEHMRSGKTMTSWCKKRKFTPSVVFNFMNSEGGESFREKFLRAREDGAHALIDDTIDIADQKASDQMRQKLRVDTRHKIAGMWNRKQFGTRPGDGADADRLTLGDLVQAAIEHGKQLALERPGDNAQDITPPMRIDAPPAIAPLTEQSPRRTRRVAT